MLNYQNILSGISLEEDPFEEEIPEEVRFYDLSSQEVTIHEAEQTAGTGSGSDYQISEGRKAAFGPLVEYFIVLYYR